MKRTQELYIFDEKINAGKMIFLSGPRQTGKTTLALNRLKETGDEFLYFNWDDPYTRREYMRNPHFLKAYLVKSKNPVPLVVFDEIHKHKNWKNIVKGLYDLHRAEAQFMITGSARLEYFRLSGDSLVGRYFSYRMLPLGVPEAAQDFRLMVNSVDILGFPGCKKTLGLLDKAGDEKFKKAFSRLLEYGGFPEPFIKSDRAFSVKWRNNYKSLLTREDLRDLTRIHDIKGIEQLLLLLPERIGSPLSINSLREDLEVNHKTVSNWLEAFKKIYLVFSIMPWSKGISRAIKKESKFYFYDWTLTDNNGQRFENMAAVMLLKVINRFNELGLGDFDLRYVRTKNGEEMDFLIIKDNRPFALFEAKRNETVISKAGHYFSQNLKVPYYQIVSDSDILESYPGDKYVVSAYRLFAITG
jgi:predicted AAA+ superfamily ATPase